MTLGLDKLGEEYMERERSSQIGTEVQRKWCQLPSEGKEHVSMLCNDPRLGHHDGKKGDMRSSELNVQ